MKLYLLTIQPDHESWTVIGVFSTLELAQSRACIPKNGMWERRPWGEWYFHAIKSSGLSEYVIMELTLDEGIA